MTLRRPWLLGGLPDAEGSIPPVAARGDETPHTEEVREMMLYGQRNRSRGFLVRLIMAHATGQTADEFVEQELALMQAERDPMVPDYPALAAEEPTGQNGDGRDAAEIPGAQ